MAEILFKGAEKVLSDADPLLGQLIKKVIAAGGMQRPEHVYGSAFEALARSIVSQQLSVKAAAAIYAKFKNVVGKEITPKRVAALTPEALRLAGLSGSKAKYLHNLAAWFSTHGEKLDDVHLTDDALIELLTEISGIGIWTVQMFLIFYLQRPDIMPVGDLGVRKGIQFLYGMKKMPSPRYMLQKTKCWRPYRSVACLYLWRGFDFGAYKDL